MPYDEALPNEPQPDQPQRDQPQPDQGKPSDSITNGLGWALLIQLIAIILSIPIMFLGWGLIQWIGLLPLYFSKRRQGYRLASTSILIVGVVGVFLNATCAALVFRSLGSGGWH